MTDWVRQLIVFLIFAASFNYRLRRRRRHCRNCGHHWTPATGHRAPFTHAELGYDPGAPLGIAALFRKYRAGKA